MLSTAQAIVIFSMAASIVSIVSAMGFLGFLIYSLIRRY